MTNEIFYFTFVYASNSQSDRNVLWDNISTINTSCSRLNNSWALLGDFNSIQDLNESNGGLGQWNHDMRQFKDFLIHNGLSDVRSTGNYHTWWNKRPSNLITRKLDRVLVNPEWISSIQNSDAYFSPWGLSGSLCSYFEYLSQAGSSGKIKTLLIFQLLAGYPGIFQICS